MTTFFDMDITCCICGKTQKQQVLMSTNAFGSPDLDSRPPEMQRSTIDHWVQRCPSCGYCARDLSQCDPDIESIIKSSAYQSILQDSSLPSLAASFMAVSYQKQQVEKFSESAWAAIHAAWVCDDKDDRGGAKNCRLEAITMINKGKTLSQNLIKQAGGSELITIDLMRRAEMFEEALQLAEETITKDIEETIIKIIQFQIKLIHAKDTQTYTQSQAEKENVSD